MYHQNWLTGSNLLEVKKELLNLQWQQSTIQLYGKTHLVPRQEYLQATKPFDYTYSKSVAIKADSISPVFESITSQVKEYTGYAFDVLFFNYYENGSKYVSWHSDNESCFIDDCAIASLSIGGQRTFKTKHNETGETETFNMSDGDLLVMPPGFQNSHKHTLTKTKKQVDPRWNITFRKLK